MKKITQTAALLLIAALAILAAASSFPAGEAKMQLHKEKEKTADTPDLSGCSHDADRYIFETTCLNINNH